MNMIADTLQTDELWDHLARSKQNVCGEIAGCYNAASKLPGVSLLTLHGKVNSCFKSAFKTENEEGGGGTVDFDYMLSRNEVWENAILNWRMPQVVNWQNSAVEASCSSFLLRQFKQQSLEQLSEEICDGDDEEIHKCFDLHSLVLDYDNGSSVTKPLTEPLAAPVPTADEVIEEIEEILTTADEQDAAFDAELQQYTGILICDNIALDPTRCELTGNVIPAFDQNDTEKTRVLKFLPLIELNKELMKLESTVKYLSESLLKELNLRDEFLYEKEVRSTFIAKIVEVQSKQEQFHKDAKAYCGRSKFGKLTKSLSMSNASISFEPGRFLTTVIPFDDSGIPSLEGLHALIKVLDAIKEDSGDVPSLITEYILKVLYPAPAKSNTFSL